MQRPVTSLVRARRFHAAAARSSAGHRPPMPDTAAAGRDAAGLRAARGPISAAALSNFCLASDGPQPQAAGAAARAFPPRRAGRSMPTPPARPSRCTTRRRHRASHRPAFPAAGSAYDGKEAPGTIVIDTPHHFLYLVEEDGKALRYGIGVGRPGFTWSGTHKISSEEGMAGLGAAGGNAASASPYLPHFMAGGPNNPLGARALYLGSTLYRIHGSNEPWTIGQNVSSGCIRMRNADVIDLYSRVKVGTKVKVL